MPRRGKLDGKVGLSQLDIDCKEAIQELLRPRYYGIANFYVESASEREKQDVHPGSLQAAFTTALMESKLCFDQITQTQLTVLRVVPQTVFPRHGPWGRSNRLNSRPLQRHSWQNMSLAGHHTFPLVADADRPGKNPYLMADVGRIKITTNPRGRERESKVIPVTGDRVQADLLRNQSGAQQRDPQREKERRYMARYSEIPSTSSVADFFDLHHFPVEERASMQVLTEKVRKKLKHWQVLGPEQNPHDAAEMMRGLQTCAAVCERMPRYADWSARSTGKVHERLFGYSQFAPKGSRTLKEVPTLRRTPLSSSAPLLQSAGFG
ncbi:unnamed protein product [Durusdinium trenchii]|uniref:Uncharacterized protein n=1 Tax=Durusdinium trenchii TaxID=1381693 RepID=A0ABP0RX11_9DINO